MQGMAKGLWRHSRFVSQHMIFSISFFRHVPSIRIWIVGHLRLPPVFFQEPNRLCYALSFVEVRSKSLEFLKVVFIARKLPLLVQMLWSTVLGFNSVDSMRLRRIYLERIALVWHVGCFILITLLYSQTRVYRFLYIPHEAHVG